LPTIRTKHLETLIHTMLATLDVCFRKVEIVQFHALGSSPFAWIPRLFGKRSIVSVRGLDWQRAKWGRFARACLRACEWTSIYCPNATIVVSRTLKNHFDGRFDRRSHYIPNGVSMLEERPPDAIRQWGLKHRSYFFYAGRISPEKGLEDLIEAHRPMAGDYPLVIAGGSSYSDAYIRRLHEVADGKVIFTGFVEGDLLAELYSNALAFVLPSEMEGLSVALLEALTYGLPAIVSDIPENRELVDEFGGFVFRVNDVDSLAAAIRRVAADSEAALRIGRAAQAGVRARLSWDAISDETERFYRALTDT
ncbi:MAG TPA: glycosyltransferase family 4 protein, partial [Candidatus Polarisedimenticolia bacterium]|nr:glycosyltransferase family 4 protein [Candidatus Polarisedimenticolia bacterium]